MQKIEQTFFGTPDQLIDYMIPFTIDNGDITLGPGMFSDGSNTQNFSVVRWEKRPMTSDEKLERGLGEHIEGTTTNSIPIGRIEIKPVGNAAVWICTTKNEDCVRYAIALSERIKTQQLGSERAITRYTEDGKILIPEFIGNASFIVYLPINLIALDTFLSKHLDGLANINVANYERDKPASGRFVYSLSQEQLGDLGTIELRYVKETMTTFDVSDSGFVLSADYTNREKEAIKAQTNQKDRHDLVIRLGKEKRLAADQLKARRRKHLHDITQGVFQSLHQQRILPPNRSTQTEQQGARTRLPGLSPGLQAGLSEGYFGDASPPKDSLLKEFLFPGSLQHFKTFMKRLIDNELSSWTASSGVWVEVQDTFPPTPDLPIARWHIRTQLTNNPDAWATLTAYEEGPNMSRIFFYDGFNAISEPHERPRLGEVLKELAFFIIRKAMKNKVREERKANTGKSLVYSPSDFGIENIGNVYSIIPNVETGDSKEDEKKASEPLTQLEQGILGVIDELKTKRNRITNGIIAGELFEKGIYNKRSGEAYTDEHISRTKKKLKSKGYEV